MSKQIKNMTRKGEISNHRVQGSFRPSTVDIEKRTIEVVFTTGQAGQRYDFYNDVHYIEELEVNDFAVRTDRLDKGLSVIDNHNVYEGIDGVFGITEGYRFENGELIGAVRFAKDPDSEIKFTKAADGILPHVSLGYRVHKFQKFRGINDELDTYRAVDWEPTELSFTPVSFEDNNGVRAEQRNLNEVNIEDYLMTKEQLARIRALQGSANRTADEDKELINLLTMQTRSFNVETPTVAVAPIVPEPTRAIAPIVPEPVVNLTEVRSNTRAELQPMLDAASAVGIKVEFATRAFNEEKSLDEFRGLLLGELANKDSKQIISVAGTALNSDERADAKSQTRQDAENYLMIRGGKKIESTEGIRQFTGMTLLDMGRDFVESSGIKTRGLSPMALAQRAFHTTSDFPLILENVMNKSVQNAYTETPQTFADLGVKGTMNDFREKHIYSLGDAPNLKPLGENGEYQAGTFGEGKEKYSISTYARKIAFTRQLLINDDMSVLTRMPSMFGAAGSRLESDIVWGLILGYNFLEKIASVHLMEDGNPLFDAAHGNLLTGAGSVFGVDSISDLRQLGRKTKTIDGNFMNISYQNFVLPYELETNADKILTQNFAAITSITTNPFTNKFSARVEPRLSELSATAWYAFSNMADTFEYAGLAGEENMMVEVETQTDVDGLEIKVRKDFGAGLIDYRGMAKSDGA
jgi:hypothetical protein